MTLTKADLAMIALAAIGAWWIFTTKKTADEKLATEIAKTTAPDSSVVVTGEKAWSPTV